MVANFHGVIANLTMARDFLEASAFTSRDEKKPVTENQSSSSDEQEESLAHIAAKFLKICSSYNI